MEPGCTLISNPTTPDPNNLIQQGQGDSDRAATHDKLRRLGAEMIQMKVNLSDWRREIMDEIYNGIQGFDHKLTDLELKLVNYDKTIRMIEHSAKVSMIISTINNYI